LTDGGGYSPVDYLKNLREILSEDEAEEAGVKEKEAHKSQILLIQPDIWR